MKKIKPVYNSFLSTRLPLLL